MASASLQSPHHRLLRHRHRHNQSFPCTDSLHFPKPTTTTTTSTKKIFSSLSSSSLTPSTTTTTTTTTSPSSSSSSLDQLAHHLSARNFREADEETRRLIIVLAGEAAQKRSYVFFSEVQFISASDLQAIDKLWREHSGGRFGYSVQKRLWEKARRDFTPFFLKVGWMKKLDTEIEQYNYRSFPTEFKWELDDGVPEGHLPLSNALRGTQLLSSILTHPAFETGGDELEGEGEAVDGGRTAAEQSKAKKAISSLKPDYSF